MLKNRHLPIAYSWIAGLMMITILALALKTNPVSSESTIQIGERPSSTSIVFTKTVGLNPSECATTDTINIVGSTAVVYCYAVKNTGSVTLTRHTLKDSAIGTIFDDLYLPIGPGDTQFFTVSLTLNATTVTTASWDAYDVETYTINDTVPYTFTDISTTGVPITLAANGSQNVGLFANVQFFSDSNHHFRISNNGIVKQSIYSGATGGNNKALPIASSNFKRTYFAYWDDLDDSLTGRVYYTETGTAPNRLWIFQWNDLPHVNDIGSITVQAILKEGVHEILFNYADVDFGDPALNGGASATIGLQKNNTTAVQYSFNTASITNGMTIQFDPVLTEASGTHTATVNLNPALPGIDTVYVSAGTAGTTNDGVAYGPEDILAYDANTGAWSLFFDGSTQGVTTDIDAFHIRPNGRIIMSFTTDTILPGSSRIFKPEDLAMFKPEGGGSWVFAFDGSDVGLNANNIDGLGIKNGNIIATVSTAFSTFAPEDVIGFSKISYGSNTSGTWSLVWDGSANGYGASQTNALWAAAGNTYNLSSDVTFETFDPADVYNTNTGLILDAAALGLGSANVDGLYIDTSSPFDRIDDIPELDNLR